jgi:hypothetical protein
LTEIHALNLVDDLASHYSFVEVAIAILLYGLLLFREILNAINTVTLATSSQLSLRHAPRFHHRMLGLPWFLVFAHQL